MICLLTFVFCHYSGHDAYVDDTNEDDEDGYDETLVPSDYLDSVQTTDDILYERLVVPMSEGGALKYLFDCCHSGMILNLPYVFLANGKSDQKII